MNITFTQVKSSDDFENPELKKRIEESSHSRKTIHYRVTVDGKEVAFIALDRWPELGQMVVYELWVPQRMRRQGIATTVLSETERITACEGLSVVRVHPATLDGSVTEETLFGWYSRLGYSRDSNIPSELFKIVGGEYWYAYHKFEKAVRILAIGAEDVKHRLLDVWTGVLKGLDDHYLPIDLQKDFNWIRTQLYNYNESYPGEIASHKRWDYRDPIFKTKFPYPDPVESTLKRIQKKTGKVIAERICAIYESLKTRRCCKDQNPNE